jgi:hypothetical protein
VAARYRAAGRQDDVLELRRSVFQAERSLANYRALRRAATNSGTWQVEGPKALAELGRDAKIRPAGSWNSSVLIDALLDDGDLDAAWTAADSGATQDQWIRLADASVATRPADALAVYLKAIKPLTEQTGDNVDHQMARLLLSARACHEALGTPGGAARPAGKAQPFRTRSMSGLTRSLAVSRGTPDISRESYSVSS